MTGEERQIAKEKSDKELVEKIIKDDLEKVFRDTHHQLLENHPDQKDVIDQMLETKLKKIGLEP